jgi:hypothetical protein
MLPAAVLVADYRGTLDLLDRTEMRLRTTQELAAPAGIVTNAQTDVGYDIFTQPTIRANVTDRRWTFGASYAPSFTFPELETGFTPVILNTGDAHVAWLDRVVTASFTQTASYGQLNGAYLAPVAAQVPVPGQPPVVTAVPAPVTIKYVASRTTGSLGIRLDPRNQVTASAEYDVTGGTDTPSRLVVPEQYGPRANVTYEYLFSQRDALLTTALYQNTAFNGLQCLPANGNPNALFACSPENHIFEAGEAMRHRITREAAIALGAGVASSVSRQQDFEPFQTTFYPTGEALFSLAFARPSEEAYGSPSADGDAAILASSLRISGRLAPLVDIRTGNVYNAVDVEGGLVVPASMRVALRVSSGYLQYLPAGSTGAVSLVHGDAEIDFAPARTVTFALGDRIVWQEQIGYGTFLSSYGFLAVTVREPRLTF